MKTLLKKFETAMVAAAFAEEGEFETARQIMNEDQAGRTTGRRSVDQQETVLQEKNCVLTKRHEPLIQRGPLMDANKAEKDDEEDGGCAGSRDVCRRRGG